MQTINLNLDTGGMRPIVEAFKPYDYNQDFNINISHTRNSRINVEKYPLLCSIVNEIRSKGNTCNININCQQNCSQLMYAERMGFLSSLGIQYQYPLVKRNGGGRFIELRNISNIFFPGQDLLDLFQKDFNFTYDQALDISTVISELVNNGYMHATSSGGVMLYAQKYPSQNFLNLFIIDSGIGIFNAMNTVAKYNHLDELGTLKKSLEFGEGNGKGFGQGLYLVSQFVKRNNGTLLLVTGGYSYSIGNGKENFEDTKTHYKGVILNLKLSFNITTSIEDIMNEKIN